MGNGKSHALAEDGSGSSGLDDIGSKSAQLRKVELPEMTSEVVLGILYEIIQSQEQIKLAQIALSTELSSQDLSFEQVYAKVSDVHPSDPLEKHGLSLFEFDQLLAKYRCDPSIRETVKLVRGQPGPGSKPSDRVQAITVETIVTVYSFMLAQLQHLMEEQLGKACVQNYDRKFVVIVVQAIVGVKIQEKFRISPEDIESAISLRHAELDLNQEFMNVKTEIGGIMQGILHEWGKASFMKRKSSAGEGDSPVKQPGRGGAGYST